MDFVFLIHVITILEMQLAVQQRTDYDQNGEYLQVPLEAIVKDRGLMQDPMLA